MKTYLHALAMCQSMFCAIPVPCKVWDEEARDKMLLFLPLVGLEIGALWVAAAWLCGLLALPPLVKGLVLAVYPYLVTGFLHLDGFMDVTDAVGSCRSLERRREILKDSRVGAFAVIGVVVLMLAQFAFLASAGEHSRYGVLLFVPAVSRCCSALAVSILPPMTTSQYAARKKNKAHIALLAALLLVLAAGGILLWGRSGFALLGCVAAYGLALAKAYGSLQGMNGDISGYALTLGELGAVAVFALL